MATSLMAGCTATDALLAVVVAAAIAIRKVVWRSAITAVVAILAMPCIQGHMRTARVVVRQHAAHETKGIGKSALLQRVLNGQLGIARAELTVADMRMGHRLVGGGRVGLQSDDLKALALGLARQAAPAELHGERAKVDVF